MSDEHITNINKGEKLNETKTSRSLVRCSTIISVRMEEENERGKKINEEA